MSSSDHCNATTYHVEAYSCSIILPFSLDLYFLVGSLWVLNPQLALSGEEASGTPGEGFANFGIPRLVEWSSNRNRGVKSCPQRSEFEGNQSSPLIHCDDLDHVLCCKIKQRRDFKIL